MAIIWAGLTPHPPIIVETVGGDRCREVQTTIDSMRALFQDMTAAAPGRLVLISPHAPRPHRGLGAWTLGPIGGDLQQFGATQPQIELPVDEAWMKRFQVDAPAVTPLASPLDHGTMVPLCFAVEAGWRGPTCVLGLPCYDGFELDLIGKAVALACADEVPTALIASGDMSHCLLPDGPYGYEPQGPLFDNAFVACLQRAAYAEALDLDADLKREAKQDVVESCRIAWQATHFRHDNHHFYSYEGPFGVGYSVMRFFSEKP